MRLKSYLLQTKDNKVTKACLGSTFIEPGGYTTLDKGNWGHWKHCNEGHHVMGMRLKIAPKLVSRDDTALNAIRLTCTDGEELVSAEQYFGDWQDYTQSADRTITRVKLRSAPQLAQIQNWWHEENDGDNTAANGIRFQDGQGNNYSPGDGNWGAWGEWASCPIGTVIMGFRTYVMPPQGSGDDTALERVQFKCSKSFIVHGELSMYGSMIIMLWHVSNSYTVVEFLMCHVGIMSVLRQSNKTVFVFTL